MKPANTKLFSAAMLILSILGLTSCAPTRTALVSEKVTTQEEATTTSLEPIKGAKKAVPTSFQLSGAIAAKNHKKGWTATIFWKQNGPEQYQMRLIGPLGGQTVMIEKQHAVTTYREGAKKISSTNDGDLLQKQTGIRLPVSHLYYWVRGIPAPGAIQEASYSPNHELTTLKQAGYIIEYTQYMTVGGTSLPRKIRLYGHDLTIKLIVQQWQ